MLTRHALLPCIVLLLAGLSACGGGGSSSSGPSGGTPVLPATCIGEAFMLAEQGRQPADGATGVARNSSLLLRFNAPVDAESVTARSIVLTGAGAGELHYQVSGELVTVTPAVPLQPHTEYTLTLTGELRDTCETPRTLRAEDSVASTFVTGADEDHDQPELVSLAPVDGELLADIRAPLTITFSKAIAPASVAGNVALIREGDNSPVAGTLEVEGAELRFVPSAPLPQQAWFRLSVTTNVRDMAGNALAAPVSARFRTGGMLVQLNDTVLRQIPGLGDGVDLLAGELFAALGISGREAGLGGVDNMLVLTLPLISELGRFDPANPEDFFREGLARLPDGTNALVAVCHPGTPGERCLLSVELNVNPLALEGFALALADGDPAEALQQLANALTSRDGLLGLELALLEPGFEALLPGPLAAAVSEGLAQLQQGLAAIPVGVLGELLGAGTEPLVRIGLLNGSLLSLGSADGLSNVPAGFLAGLLVTLVGDFSAGLNFDSLPLGPLRRLLGG